MSAVGLLDALLGRSKPVPPDLDRLFSLPSAALTLEAGADLLPTGRGAVCFAGVEGGAFQQLERDVTELLDADVEADTGSGAAAVGGAEVPVELSRDGYGYTWLLARKPPDRLSELVTDLHAVNSLLEEAGFGPQLLCSLVGFRTAGQQPEGSAAGLALVYLYKRGTFYPFAPLPGAREQRDNALELQVRGMLADDLAVEPELGRWFPLWGAPGL